MCLHSRSRHQDSNFVFIFVIYVAERHRLTPRPCSLHEGVPLAVAPHGDFASSSHISSGRLLSSKLSCSVNHTTDHKQPDIFLSWVSRQFSLQATAQTIPSGKVHKSFDKGSYVISNLWFCVFSSPLDTHAYPQLKKYTHLFMFLMWGNYLG